MTNSDAASFTVRPTELARSIQTRSGETYNHENVEW